LDCAELIWHNEDNFLGLYFTHPLQTDVKNQNGFQTATLLLGWQLISN